MPDDILKKFQDGSATPEDLRTALKGFDAELAKIKSEDPARYATIIKSMTAGLAKINDALEGK